MPNDVPERVRFGPYEVDLHTHELWKHGTRLKLVGQPFEILAVLLARPSELVTRDELRERLWPGDTFVDFNHGLNAAVNKLREALSDSAEEPRYIETLPRRGYRFIAKVEPVAPETKAQATPVSTPVSPQSIQPTAPSPQPTSTSLQVPVMSTPPVASSTTPCITLKPRRGSSWRKLLALTVVLVVGTFIARLAIKEFRAWLRRHSGEDIEAFLKSTNPRTAPLLPLTNLSDATSDPAFSPDGNRVAFRRDGVATGTSGIFVKTVGTMQLLQLTNSSADCCPIWSPDGKKIAFSRFTGKEHVIYTVPATGGELDIVCSAHVGPKRGELDWSPDGKFIAFTGEYEAGSSSIFLVSVKDQTFRHVTQPPPLNKDWGPTFSPDGQSLAFIRTRETGLPEMIMVMPVGGGETRVLFTHNNGLVGPPTWSADSQYILFATGDPNLVRVSVASGEVSDVPGVSGPAWRPAVSRRGYRLAYQKISRAVSVVQLDLDQAAKPHSYNPVVTNTGTDSAQITFSESEGPRPHGVIVTDTGRNEGAQVAPDGKKIAFMSNRSGSMEIWMSDRDGSNAIQLTAMGIAGTPRWSPDSRSLVFDRDTGNNGGIFIVNVDQGPPHPLVQESSQNLVPSWSQDGKWIYFASNRSNAWQVWKVPSGGGIPVQVTARGGFAAYESHDGKYLYYSKLNMPSPEIWRMPVTGGPETRVSSLLRPETWASWALVDRGILFVAADTAGDPSLMFLDFASGDVKHMAKLDRTPFWLTATPDAKSVLYEHMDQENSQIMLLENFH